MVQPNFFDEAPVVGHQVVHQGGNSGDTCGCGCGEGYPTLEDLEVDVQAVSVGEGTVCTLERETLTA